MPSTFPHSIALKRSLSFSRRLAGCSLGFALFIAQAFVGSGVARSETRAAGGELPKRAPGLWKITTISPKIGMHVGEACVEEGDSIIGTLEEGCRTDVTRASDQVIVTITCEKDRGREVTSILFTGDFQNWYRGQSKTTEIVQEGGPSRHSGFTIEARRLGDCPSEKK
jgi:hypothetical protein